MSNLYKILGIKNDASQDEMKKAYFVMAKKYHPDSSDESEVKKFYEVAEAYQVLSNEDERKAYDLTLGGGKIEKVLVEDKPSHPTIFKEEVPKDKELREKEMKSFKSKILFQGIVRVIGFSLMMLVFGYVMSFVLKGILYLGLVFGFLIGLVWSINKNFDVDSFIENKKKLSLIKKIGLIILFIGVGYFCWLLLLIVF